MKQNFLLTNRDGAKRDLTILSCKHLFRGILVLFLLHHYNRNRKVNDLSSTLIFEIPINKFCVHDLPWRQVVGSFDSFFPGGMLVSCFAVIFWCIRISLICFVFGKNWVIVLESPPVKARSKHVTELIKNAIIISSSECQKIRNYLWLALFQSTRSNQKPLPE